MPVKGRDGLVEIDSRKLSGTLSAGGPADADPAEFDLVVLAMQEPQYRAAGVRELLDAVAKAKVPCMSIMNMPPLPYLARIPGLDVASLPRLLHRCERLGRLRSPLHDAVQPGRAGVSPAGGKGQRAAGEAADQLQGRAFRFGRSARAMLRRLAIRHRGRETRYRARPDRGAGQAPRARLDLRAAREMGDAARRQLSLRAARTACAASRTPCTPTSRRRDRCTSGWSKSACRSARPRAISSRSTSTQAPR